VAKTEQRIQDDVQDQDGAAAIIIGQAPEQEGAQRPHRQGQGQGQRDGRNLDIELLGDVRHHEGQDEKVEGIQGPAQIGGGDACFCAPVQPLSASNAMPPLL
jgi:hypothetical protein